MYVKCDVTLSSDNSTLRTFKPGEEISGEGTLALKNVRIYTQTYAVNHTIKCPVEVVENASFYLYGARASITATGSITGSGTLTLEGTSLGSGTSELNLTGDLSGFEGKLSVKYVSSYFSPRLGGDDTTLNLSGSAVELADNATLLLNGAYRASAK